MYALCSQLSLQLFDARNHYHAVACTYCSNLNTLQTKTRVEFLERLVRLFVCLEFLAIFSTGYMCTYISICNYICTYIRKLCTYVNTYVHMYLHTVHSVDTRIEVVSYEPPEVLYIPATLYSPLGTVSTSYTVQSIGYCEYQLHCTVHWVL